MGLVQEKESAMNRRTLLKGTAAGSALMFSMRLGVHRSRAQAPTYVAEIIYEFTEFKGESYVVLDDGFPWGVTRDGLITGNERVDGVVRPVTWDLAGTRSLLDTGDIPFLSAQLVYPGPAGYLVGNLLQQSDPESLAAGVLWTNGTPTLVEANPSGSVSANAVNSSGMVVGSMSKAPARWIDGQTEQLPIPDGADSASISSLTEEGDGFGTARTSTAISSAFMWKRDGSVEPFTFPDEMTANGLEEVSFASIPAFFENGDFVFSATWNDASGSIGGSWLYQAGVPQKVASSAEDTFAGVRYALDPQTMIGSMNHGAGAATGFTGATIWIDGIPYSLQELTTFPEGITTASVRGITADGTIVASSFVSSSDQPKTYILALRPA